MEFTNVMKLEVTVIEKGYDDDENVMPFGVADKNELVQEIKKRLDCDDVQLKSFKQFICSGTGGAK